ncbi:lysozyme [Saccharopolyspora antimicrobica]|uniref:Lysozyme n=1 Tax=Saccharopolyspora antimicrobica TaxID=455193 RepID=A0A1I4RJT1_9PSEU|nr:lysozyme [Saccharopolyspora antimicrobica]RKT87990.1 lysozyme [Saccharopolyspora antimicrobica]SFM52253.1 lysozyme [Saccharopolyspora antimicrobica]
MRRSFNDNHRRSRSGRRPRRTAGLLAALVAAATVVTGAAHAETTSPRSAPLLDPQDPHGAWAGYSLPTNRSGQPPQVPAGVVSGMDVSGHQGNVDWARAWADGARFAYVKATEGSGFRNTSFAQQYDGSHAVGMVRGAYHFGLPDRSSGAQQAHFFVDSGGGWHRDGRTLPGALDIEYNPYGDGCYGLDPAAMSRWIADFSNTYHARTGRFPAIYTTTDWWNRCTGANPDFAANNPLWIARYAPQIGELPAGWDYQSIWQHGDQGPLPGGQDSFNGNTKQLRRFAS